MFLISPTFLTHTTDIDVAFDASVALSILVFTINSYVVLFIICTPMDRYRIIVFSVVAALGLGVGIADFFWRRDTGHGELISVPWNGLSVQFIPILILSVGLSLGIFLLLRHLLKKVNKKVSGTEEKQ